MILVLISDVVVPDPVDVEGTTKLDDKTHVLNFVSKRTIIVLLVQETETLLGVLVDVTIIEALPDLVELLL